MKVFISADIEGVTGCTTWEETIKDHKDYPYFALQMTKEVDAACKGANAAGAEEILIKDAHETGTNIDHNLLPQNTKLVRSSSGENYSMVQELDSTYDALIFIGYHSASGQNTNPLSHTMNASTIDYIRINGRIVSEFILHAYIGAYLKVPVVFLAGDLGLEGDIDFLDKNIEFVPVKEGKGQSTINIHPQLALERIQKRVREALSKDLSKYKIELPEEFNVEIRYREHFRALHAKDYPGVRQVDEHTVAFESKDYMEVLSLINFIVS